MIIAAAKITLDFYGNDYLSKKNSEVKKLIKLVRSKFSIDFCEVDAFVDPEKCVLAFSLCGSDEGKLKKRVDTVALFVDKNSFARVVSDDREYFHFDSAAPGD
jgi:uncharacterized protein YlxP (DUF503 family)